MPELPEVETVVRDLNKKIINSKIVGVKTDWQRHFSRSPGGFTGFKKQAVGAVIKNVRRIGKNIIFDLESAHGAEKTMLIHLKMTGHLLIGNNFKKVLNHKTLNDSRIHTVFKLSRGGQKFDLAFSDTRKFGKIIIADRDKFLALEDIAQLGPDAFTSLKIVEFLDRISQRRGIIKKVLLDQKFIAGIGNIYADELLHMAGVHPEKRVEKLKKEDLVRIFNAIKIILKKAVALRGTSSSDYRDTSGRAGKYLRQALVYGREGSPCQSCGSKIKKIKIGARSAHFCEKCQKK